MDHNNISKADSWSIISKRTNAVMPMYKKKSRGKWKLFLKYFTMSAINSKQRKKVINSSINKEQVLYPWILAHAIIPKFTKLLIMAMHRPTPTPIRAIFLKVNKSRERRIHINTPTKK